MSEQTGNKQRQGKRATNWWFWTGILGSIGYVAFVVWWQIISEWNTAVKMKPNEWGDFAAGLAAPLAFAWLVAGYRQQGRELQQSVKALESQAEGMATAASLAKAELRLQVLHYRIAQANDCLKIMSENSATEFVTSFRAVLKFPDFVNSGKQYKNLRNILSDEILTASTRSNLRRFELFGKLTEDYLSELIDLSASAGTITYDDLLENCGDMSAPISFKDQETINKSVELGVIHIKQNSPSIEKYQSRLAETLNELEIEKKELEEFLK